MTGRYSSIIIMTLLMTTSSFAASAILPPLPNQPPPALTQDAARPPPVVTTEPTPPAVNLPTPKQDTVGPALPPPPNPVPTTPAPSTIQKDTTSPPSATGSQPEVKTPAPAPGTNAPSASSSKGNSLEEHESFIDTGQTKLPRIEQRGDDGSSANSYNASDLRIPVIESEDKAAKQNHPQPEPQISKNAPPVAPKETAPAPSSPPQASSAPLPAPSAPQTPANEVATPSSPVQVALPETHPAPAAPARASVAPAAAQVPPIASIPSPVPAVSPLIPATSGEHSETTASAIIPAPAPAASIVASPLNKTAKIDTSPASMPGVITPTAIISHAKPEVLSAEHKHKNKNIKHKVEHNHKSEPEPLTPDHIKFINDEAIVFLLPDDDIELGDLTKEARIEQMSGSHYIKLFWKNYEFPQDEARKRDVDLFLAMYENHPPEAYEGAMNYDDESDQAFDAVYRGNLSDLRAIITYYPVLQMRDARGDNMLASAIESDNLDVARFLLIRGIDLYATNYEGYDLFSIAQNENNEDASTLLESARFLGRR